MKNFIFKILFFISLTPLSLMAIENCASKYNCTADGKTLNGVFIAKDLNCTLPSPDANMTITALDVFESDGMTLKTYFG